MLHLFNYLVFRCLQSIKVSKFKFFATKPLESLVFRQNFTTKLKIMDTFSSLRIKTEVTKKFRTFSKSVAPTHTEALADMVSFFIENKISPHEDCGPHFLRLEKNILKRINALIAIIKDIEKNQSKPTMAMLQALFENVEPKQKLLVEKSFEQLEKERLNREFIARLKEKSENDFKKDGNDKNN